MRSILAGLLILALSTAALGQVTGFVESIGYENYYRPECWTPILVNLSSQFSDAESYQLQVWQEDMDRDRVVYTKDITLSPHVQDKFQLYFLPRPTDGGLPQQPAEALHVRLVAPLKEGQKPEDAKVIIDRLPVRFPIVNLEPDRTILSGHQRGIKVVLVISDRGEQPAVGQYATALGLTEDAAFIHVPIQELGENVLYYNSVDAVLWLDGDADNLDKGGAHRLEALEEFVREGGDLVVCQPTERARISALSRLLPVELKDASDNWEIEFVDRPKLDPTLDALPQMSMAPRNRETGDDWTHLKGPFSVARAKKLKPDAVVAYWDHQDWKDVDHINPDRTPYVVRHPFGMGAVTWVAQDLGSRNLQGVNTNGVTHWPVVWDRVFGWNNDTYVTEDYSTPDSTSKKIQDQYGQGSMPDQPIDLGLSFRRGMDFQGKGAAYVFVAILFFIFYWVAAGPGTYLFLATKKRKEWNWFMFGAWAFAATALTLVLVRLILRGAPEVRHQTIVRIVPNEPAYVHSRIGLYIPQDGYRSVALAGGAKDRMEFISPYPIFPGYLTASDFPAAQDYAIPIHDDPQPPNISVPYRSTLKKLQARWVGDLQCSIVGDVKLVPGLKGYIDGKLTNQSGADLKNVYFIFSHTGSINNPHDWIMHLSEWPKSGAGATIDLNTQFHLAVSARQPQAMFLSTWMDNTYRSFPSSSFTGVDDRGDDFESSPRKTFLIASLIDRLQPDKTLHQVTGDVTDHNRIELQRHGIHDLNVSSAVGAGNLVILAEGKDRESPLPFPLEVDGAQVQGKGVVLYQFILPLDKTQMNAALEDSTPTTNPAGNKPG